MSNKAEDNTGSLSAAIRLACKNMLKEVHTTIPGYIVSFNPTTQSAQVQVSIRRVYVNNRSGEDVQTAVQVPALIHVPVIFLRGGGWCITFPVKAGDECIVHFSERAIDTWRKNGGVQDPKDWRMHDYSDAICQVGLSSEANIITDFDNANMQIRNEEGDVSVTLKANKDIEITSPNITLNAANTTLTGDLRVDGSVGVGGDIGIDGNSTAADHISGTVSGKTHTHPVTSAPGTTGAPLP